MQVSEREEFVNELKRSNKELNEFAYVASHDLKAPLRGVEQLAGWLEQDLAPVLDDSAKLHLQLMRVRIRRMSGLLDDLLAYSRAGQEERKPKQEDLEALILGIFDLVNNNPQFHLSLEIERGEYYVTRSPLETVLRNLINNAIKHHDQTEGEITVRVSRVGNMINFEVTDDGPGIPAEHVDRVFGMFQTHAAAFNFIARA